MPKLLTLKVSENNLTGDLSSVSRLQTPPDAEVWVMPQAGAGICGPVSGQRTGWQLGADGSQPALNPAPASLPAHLLALPPAH